MAEKIVITIYILSHLVSGLYLIANRKYTGEAKAIDYLTVNNITIFWMLFILVIGYFIMYGFYKATKNSKFRFIFMPRKIEVNKNKAHKFIFVVLIAQLIFSLTTGVGRVGSTATSSYSFLFSFFRVESAFLFYYILCRDRKKIFVINVILFFIYRLSLGWTWFIFQYAVIELFIYFNKHRKYVKLSNIKTVMYTGILMLLGAKVYQYLYQLKFYIRLNTWEFKLNYLDSLSALTNRFSFFPLSVANYQNLELIKLLYHQEGIYLKDILAMFRPLVPGFLMPFKYFRPMNNVFVQAIHNDITPITSSNAGIFSYATTLFYSDFFTGVLWLVLTLFLFILIASLIKALEEYEGQLNIVYFLLIIEVFNVAALEQVFSYGYLSLFYIAPFLLIFKVIKVKYGRGNNV